MKLKHLAVAFAAVVSAVSMTGVVSAQQTEKESDRLANAATVLKEIFGMPDSIPQELLDKAECVIVFPSVKKVALGVGGSYGRGVISCRSGSAFDGPVGRAGDVRARGRQHRLSDRRAGDRLRPAGHERSRGEISPRQQGQAWRGCVRGGRPERAQRRSGHRHRHAGRDPHLLTRARVVRRHLARRIDAAVGRRRQRAVCTAARSTLARSSPRGPCRCRATPGRWSIS